MKLVTIQDKKVLDILLKGKTYISDFLYSFDDIEEDDSTYIKAYQVLMQHYKYVYAPIFCCVLDRYSDFSGTKISKKQVLLELDVPDGFVKMFIQKVWVNIIDLIKHNLWDGAKFGAAISYLDGLNANINDFTVQAVIPFIKPEWLVAHYYIKFIPDTSKRYESKDVLFLSEEYYKKLVNKDK